MIKLRIGDIMEDSGGDYRIILISDKDGCYYIDWMNGNGGYFYNPCRAYVSHNAFRKYRKVGEIPKEIMDKMSKTLLEVNSLHSKAFALLSERLNDNTEFDISNFKND